MPVFLFYLLNLNAIMNFSTTEGLVFAVFGVSAGLIVWLRQYLFNYQVIKFQNKFPDCTKINCNFSVL